ncbi:hypothetical protein ACFQZT_28535 [Paenibacillus sp. GCM10027628]|uniref:hypothetical protein n=1 Tax=Paenibacillus sp. GCM10027628 TaxID=3273413 RepID=UPI0036429626
METHLKEIAEKTLKYLCVGSYIEGINFYGLKVIFSESDTNKNRLDGQIYLNIESRFIIYNTWPETFPQSEDEMPVSSWLEDSKRICDLRLKHVTNVKLGDSMPHLFIVFDSGEVLFVYGHHDKYESWQLGVLNNKFNNEVWEVVACPGDAIAIWVLEDIL